ERQMLGLARAENRGRPGFGCASPVRSWTAMTRTYRAGLLAAALAAATAAGCSTGHASSGADKAGGSSAPTVLRLADSDSIDQPETPTIRYFAGQVAKLSHGALRVDITFQAAGDRLAEVEPRTVRMVRAGRFDLCFTGPRAW